MQEIFLKYRTWWKGQKPTRIRLGDWAGERHYKTGQPHHCKPFVDGSTYGLELVYPFDTEVTVSTTNGKTVFTGDFTKEKESGNWERPFSSFAPHHFGMTSALDIQTEEAQALMILPHPRYYTDLTETVPLAVAGLLETTWWPRIFFVVFKAPAEGRTIVFRKGEGYAQVIVVPKQIKYNIVEMTKEEARRRSIQEDILRDYAPMVATRTWYTEQGESFDNKYKRLAKEKDVEVFLNELAKNYKQTKQEKARKKFRRKII